MATVLVTRAPTWLGVSTDPKPTGAPVGAAWLELDTRQAYVWTGAAWVARPKGTP